jgi:hypothetical protein
MRFHVRFAAAAVLSFAIPASADVCTGAPPFTDVSANANYCTNTEWLKNRSITLGCVGTNYCPNDAVTRGAMALFMNRLGVALSATHLFADEDAGGFTFNSPLGDNVCRTPNVPAANYPRRAFVTATYSARSTLAMQHASRVTYSTNGGVGVFNAASGFTTKASHPGADWANTTSHASIPIPAGTQVMFALQFYRESGAGDISESRCLLVAMVANDNGTSSPFDAK